MNLIFENSFILIYLLFLLYVGFRSKRKSASQDEYLLGGRSLTTPAFVATLVTTWYGGILGVGEFIYQYGIAVFFVFGIPYYFFAILFAFFLAPRIRNSETYSIPDLLYSNFDKKTGILGSLFLIVMTSPAPYILILGILLQHLFGLNFNSAIIAGTLFSIIYVYWGGFRSVVQTDKLQFLFMFSGFVILLYYLLSSDISLFELPQHLSDTHKSIDGGLSVQEFIIWILIASWTFIDPGFHQRCAAAKSGKVARNGILISVGFWFIFDMLTLITGLYALVILPDINPLLAYPELGSKILPPFYKGLFFTGLLATVMSTIDSYTLLSGITYGHDIINKLRKGNDIKNSNIQVQIGLVVSAAIAIVLILFFPSVITLWYNLGNLFIPALLFPVLIAYFPRLRVNSKNVFYLMLSGFIVSFVWLLYGLWDQVEGQAAIFPFGLEPFFPAMTVVVLLYLYFRLKIESYS